jgi:phospholipase/carboxylesterase
MKVAKLGPLTARITGGTDDQGTGTGPVVVLLHGFGAPGDDLLAFGRSVTAPSETRFVFPEAPVSLGREYMGGRAWWWIDLNARIERQSRGEKRDADEVPDGLVEARTKVIEFLGAMDRVLKPPAGKVVLGGFSQGAMLSLDVALHVATPLAGLVLMSGTHIAANEWEQRFESRRGLPVLMSHGTDDELLPFGLSESLKDTLVSHGLLVDWIPFPGGHGIAPNVVDGVSAFLARVLA